MATSSHAYRRAEQTGSTEPSRPARPSANGRTFHEVAGPASPSQSFGPSTRYSAAAADTHGHAPILDGTSLSDEPPHLSKVVRDLCPQIEKAALDENLAEVGELIYSLWKTLDKAEGRSWTDPGGVHELLKGVMVYGGGMSLGGVLRPFVDTKQANYRKEKIGNYNSKLFPNALPNLVTRAGSNTLLSRLPSLPPLLSAGSSI